MFNISEFKSRIDRHGGLSRSSLFEINLSPTNIRGETIVPDIISTDDLRFFCQTVSMPGINLEVMSYKPSGLGFSEFMPINAAPDQLNAVFMLDSNNRVMTFFHRWISAVVNISGNRGGNSRGLEPKLIEYKDTYAASELSIKHYSTHNPFQFYECRYEGVYPTQVSAIDLNWGADSSPTTMTVNFSYNRLIYSGFRDISFETSEAFLGRQTSEIRGNTITQTIRDFDTRNIDELTTQLT